VPGHDMTSPRRTTTSPYPRLGQGMKHRVQLGQRRGPATRSAPYLVNPWNAHHARASTTSAATAHLVDVIAWGWGTLHAVIVFVFAWITRLFVAGRTSSVSSGEKSRNEEAADGASRNDRDGSTGWARG
jgi:hypothetical protein